MKKILIIFMLLIANTHFAQEQALPKQNQQEIQSLKETIKKQTDTIAKYKDLVKDGSITLTKAEKVYDTAKEIYSLKDNAYMALIAIFFSLLGFFGYNYYQARRDLKEHIKETKEMHSKKIEEIFNSQHSLIENLIKKHSKEEILLRNTKILIINKEGSKKEDKFNMILKRFNNHPEIIQTEDFSDLNKNYTDYDTVILDNNDINEENTWDFKGNVNLKEQLIAIAKETCKNGNAFLYFGDNKKDGYFSDDLKEYNHLINFANKPATLFANLIDLLDFRRLIKDK